jgi:hypothetical protein
MTRALARFASSPTLRSASPGSPAQPHTKVDPSIISDADMAWLLADAADLSLTGHERTMTFVELGCGENHLAIGRILTAVVSSRMTLPMSILAMLTAWLHGYAGSPEEPQLRRTLAQIRRQQFEAVPLAQPNRRFAASRPALRRTGAPPCKVGGADATSIDGSGVGRHV